jgi:predicted metal-dependent HD superfamily phosphohydrolase
MKDQILKLAGVKSEAAFYKKFPTEAAFMKVHGKAFKKAAMGASMVNKQLHQLTDFGNPPQAQFGIKSPYDPSISGFGKNPSLDTSSPRSIGVQQPTDFGMRNSTDTSKMMGNYQSGQAIGKGLDKKAGMPQIKGEKGSDATAYLQAGMDVIEGVSMIKDKAVKEAKQNSMLTGVQAQAVGSQNQQPLKNYYARPEDTIIQPDQLFPSYGVGTNILSAQDGAMVGGNPTEIQNTYAPNTLYDDLGYEPLNDSDQIKAFYHGGKLTKAQNGFENFMLNQGGNEALGNLSNMFVNKGRGPSAGSKIGGGVGQAAGTFFGGPVGGAIGKAAGQFIGGAIDKSGRNIEKYDTQSNNNIAGMMGSFIPQQFGNVMEDGGWVSNDWQPQTITKFGEYNMDELLRPDPTMDTLRSGGSLKQDYVPPSARALQTYAMGGELQVYRGEAEPISTNPYLPDGGETVMFRGPSHENGGMPISYGSSPVEVEGGEPAVKLRDGGTGEDNMVVFGNLKIDKQSADMLGNPKLKNQKFKNYVNDLSKIEAKQNKIIDKSINTLDNLDVQSSFDKLKMSALQANLMGSNMKLKDIATKKQDAAALQGAINDTAEEYGLIADDLAQGKIKQAKLGASIPKAQAGYTSKYGLKPWEGNKDKLGAKTKSMYNAQQWDKIAETLGFKGKGNKEFQEFLLQDPNRAKLIKAKSKELYGSEDVKLDERLGAAFNIPELGRTPLDTSGLKTSNTDLNLPGTNFSKYNEQLQQRLKQDVPDLTKQKKDFDWMSVVNQALPFLRPSDQEPLDPRQLTGEMYALSQNQLEPVQAQTFQPQLQTPYDISLQDQLNEITSQTRQAERLAQNNPEALASIYAQAEMAKSKILGEQMRINQGQRAQTYASNIEALNNAKLQNIQMYDTQQQRQEGAKSATKATTQAALSSIASKYAQNKLENRQLATMENLYNYRYDKSGRAINMNPLVDFDEMIANATPDELDKYKTLLESKTSKSKTTTKDTKEGRNGSIVKAIKNL